MNPLPDITIEHVMWAYNIVLAWDSSAKHIYIGAWFSKEKDIKLYQYQNPCMPKLTKLNNVKVLSLINQWGGSKGSYGVSDVNHIINRAGNAKVHAEVVLMGHIISSPVGS